MLLTETEKALAGLLVLGFLGGPVHVPVEILDTLEQHATLKIETDMDGCYDVSIELDNIGPDDGR